MEPDYKTIAINAFATMVNWSALGIDVITHLVLAP